MYRRVPVEVEVEVESQVRIWVLGKYVDISRSIGRGTWTSIRERWDRNNRGWKIPRCIRAMLAFLFSTSFIHSAFTYIVRKKSQAWVREHHTAPSRLTASRLELTLILSFLPFKVRSIPRYLQRAPAEVHEVGRWIPTERSERSAKRTDASSS